jgi:hypothetical protein
LAIGLYATGLDVFGNAMGAFLDDIGLVLGAAGLLIGADLMGPTYWPVLATVPTFKQVVITAQEL